jgi:FkbM family methyltransferase
MGFFKRKNTDQSGSTSYSQCGEDLIVRFIFNDLQIDNPSYIDVGAHHPFYLNNTALFYEKGSTGINIEPDPQLFGEFLIHRKKDVNLNVGIGKEKGESEFYVISSPTLNTFSKIEAESYKNQGDYSIVNTINVPIDTLPNIIRDKCNNAFPDFLNVDAEGIDDLIIKSIDYENNYPLVICVETITFSTSNNGIKNIALIKYLQDKGYFAYADTYINTIFVKMDKWRKSKDS